MEPLKNCYNKLFFDEFIKAIQQIIPNFDNTSFIKNIYDDKWENRELKQRMRHIVLSLRSHLPSDYKSMIKIVLKIINQLTKNSVKGQSFEWMFLPEFIELYGLEDYKTSMRTFEKITQFTSCEFAIRPFIVKYPIKVMKQMLVWSTSQNKHVRRFSSEGCRPRLPWAMALPELKSNPKPILPILENLKNDESEYVRRSVANNLNDIAKDNPQTVIKITKKWIGKTIETDKLVKHACRTLLKQGNIEVMTIFGFGSVENIKIADFKIHTPKVKIGKVLNFSFQLKNESDSKTKIRVEYGLYFQKANGTLSKKVFKISEKEYNKNSTTAINKNHSFKIITTRKFHLGLHQVSIIVNGKELNTVDFLLV
jgi:3-methyladenine DNA glycosylase AlkC